MFFALLLGSFGSLSRLLGKGTVSGSTGYQFRICSLFIIVGGSI